jgi:Cu/Zn superoxide dismutase
MKQKNNRILFIFILVALLLALPTTALATKQAWKARLTGGAEVPAVQTAAVGNGTFIFNGGGVYFYVRVTGLETSVTGAHIHGPAAEGVNAGVVVNLCTAGTCTFDSSTGTFTAEGTILGHHLVGMNAPTFFANLDAGMLYVNVHTSAFPGGEVRGQIFPR